jgi:hypothetical protein
VTIVLPHKSAQLNVKIYSTLNADSEAESNFFAFTMIQKVTGVLEILFFLMRLNQSVLISILNVIIRDRSISSVNKNLTSNS